MTRIPRAFAGLATGALLGFGSLAHADISPYADITRDLPTISAPVGGTTATAEDSQRTDPKRYVVRMRLDDGRYRGFRQHGADELRNDDRVIVENDRIRAERRAQRNGNAYR